MYDTHDDRLSPIRPLLCQKKNKFLDSEFEAITDTYPEVKYVEYILNLSRVSAPQITSTSTF